MRSALLGGLLMWSLCGMAAAQSAPPLDRPDAFEHEFAVSFYLFDACGDQLAGRIFRRALGQKFAQCPFSTTARHDFEQGTRAEQAKARRMIADLIENRGGLPMRLDGMVTTCREQQASADYQAFRGRLAAYGDGKLPIDAILPAPCDAPEMAPTGVQ